MVIPFGTKYGCIWDCAKQPVQMFGMGNICAGTFQEDFLPGRCMQDFSERRGPLDSQRSLEIALFQVFPGIRKIKDAVPFRQMIQVCCAIFCRLAVG